MEEYIKILEEIVETYRSCSVNEEGFDMKVDIGFTKKECEALESLLTRYKEYDNLLGEIDSKEASDALYMLWHCALINKEFETQKQQFQIVNAYIKQLEEENKNMAEEYLVNNPGMAKYLKDNYIFKSKVKDKIEELKGTEELLSDEQGYWGGSDLLAKIEVLQELLREE